MQMHKHANRFYSQDGCRAALATGSKPRFDDLARELNVLVDMLEEKLSETDVPLKHQHWTMFSGLPSIPLPVAMLRSPEGYPTSSTGTLQAKRPCS